MSHRYIVTGALALCCALAASNAAWAQGYPAKTVRIVVPFSAGGGTDITARAMARKLTEAWGQQVIVDNRPGASGMIGGDIVAKAAPDGYTALVSSISEVTTNQNVYPKMQYNPERDLAPVTLAAITPLLLVVHPSLPAKSVRELIGLSKSRAGQLTYSTPGTGSVHHLAGELFKMTTKADITHVPYKGAAPAVIDLLGGQVSSSFTGMPPAVPHVKAGKLRALAVTTQERSSALPTIQTLSESGVPGFDVSNWFGVFVPAGTPPAIISKLYADMARALKMPDVKELLATQGAEAVGSSPDDFRRFWHAEIAKYAKVIKQANVRAD